MQQGHGIQLVAGSPRPVPGSSYTSRTSPCPSSAKHASSPTNASGMESACTGQADAWDQELEGLVQLLEGATVSASKPSHASAASPSPTQPTAAAGSGPLAGKSAGWDATGTPHIAAGPHIAVTPTAVLVSCHVLCLTADGTDTASKHMLPAPTWLLQGGQSPVAWAREAS